MLINVLFNLGAHFGFITLILFYFKLKIHNWVIVSLWVHKRLQKCDININSVVNCINILRVHFSYKSASRSFFYLHVTIEKLLKRLLYEQGTHKMLMKLTPG